MTTLTRKQRMRIVMLVDALFIFVSAFLAEFILKYYVRLRLEFILIYVALMIVFYWGIGLSTKAFSKINRFINYRDLTQLATIIGVSTILSTGVLLLFEERSFRFSLLVAMFSAEFIVAIRFLWIHISRTRHQNNEQRGRKSQRILVVGAGQGGQAFITSMQDSRPNIQFAGIVDDSEVKQGTYLNDIPILGKIQDIPKILEDDKVDEVIVAIPSLPSKRYEDIFELVNHYDVPVKKMPSIEDVMLGKVEFSHYTDIDITDLLGREEVKLDNNRILGIVKDETVMITGAGGSIGSELVRQLTKFNPARILLVGHGENSIYQIHREMQGLSRKNTEFIPIIADVVDAERMDHIMQAYQPRIVFHAAAHKHVPMMEYNPTEAVKNNIYGTKNVAEMAGKNNVERFVMISTDKANNPTNVMGATKRISEMIVAGLNAKYDTIFSAVRFGNVLGSRGSVIPLFQEQIEKGGPVTVTDFRMTRFFMTIPEASRLVIQAGSYASGGEIFVLDMGEAVNILDLAKKLIKVNGYREDEIEIVEAGIRPGEKLYEELLLDDETTGEKIFDKIFTGKVNNKPLDEIKDFVESLDLSGNSDDEISKQLIAYVQH